MTQKTNTLSDAEIRDKVFNLTLRLIEIKKDRAATNKDFKERIAEVEDEIEELIKEGAPTV